MGDIVGISPSRPVMGTASTGALRLDLLGGDVWAWEKLIIGTSSGLDPAATIDIVVNGRRNPADRDGNRFEAMVRLEPGDNTVQAVARLGQTNIGSDTVIHTVRLSPRPVARISTSIAPGGTMVLDGSGSERSAFDDAVINRYTWSYCPNAPSPSQSAPFSKSIIDVSGQPTSTMPVLDLDGEYLVSLTILDDQGREDTATSMLTVDEGQSRIVDPVVGRAAWNSGATVYGVVVRNVGPNGFQSVIDRLDDLADLGIAALWLAPINVTTPGDFGYGVVDYFDVRPEYGTLDDFRLLVREAHARNIRVLMDVVPNHTSSEHPCFREAERHGPASPHYGFYDRDEHGTPTHYFTWTHLPNLDFNNVEVRRFISEALMFWVRELDVDGFRIDVAWGVKQRRPDFWPEFSAEFHRVKPDGLLIAEAGARDSYYVNHGFGAAYDWTDELGVWAWTDVFTGDLPISTAIKDVLANHDGQGYDPESLVFRFLNNNDTGPRFITRHGVDLYRVASAMLLTLPGLPCLFTGDEVGAEFEPYVNAGPIDWTDRHGLRSHFRKLIHLRNRHPGLKSRTWTVLNIEPANHLFGYVRHAPNGASPLLILLNFGPEDFDASIDPDDLPTEFGGSGSVFDLYNETTVALNMVSTADCRSGRARKPPAEPVLMRQGFDIPLRGGCLAGARHDSVGTSTERQSASDSPPAGPHWLKMPVGPWGVRILAPEGTRQ